MYYILTYHTVDNYVNLRAPFRTEHLALANSYRDRGIMIMGGALANPVDKAIVIFKSDSTEEIEEFVRQDPYVQNGLVKSWEIREWTVVVGGEN